MFFTLLLLGTAMATTSNLTHVGQQTQQLVAETLADMATHDVPDTEKEKGEHYARFVSPLQLDSAASAADEKLEGPNPFAAFCADLQGGLPTEAAAAHAVLEKALAGHKAGKVKSFSEWVEALDVGVGLRAQREAKERRKNLHQGDRDRHPKMPPSLDRHGWKAPLVRHGEGPSNDHVNDRIRRHLYRSFWFPRSQARHEQGYHDDAENVEPTT